MFGTQLQGHAEAPRYIQTLPRPGYRFIAPVEGAVAPTPSRPWKAAVPVLAAIGAAILLIFNVPGPVMRYKRTNKPIPQIAREWNVDAVVESTVLRSGKRVRITANYHCCARLPLPPWR